MRASTLMLAIAVLASGCVKLRDVTAVTSTEQGVYVAYWEGTCKFALGCDVGDGKVQFCKLDPATNALACKEQTSITPLLDRKAKLP